MLPFLLLDISGTPFPFNNNLVLFCVPGRIVNTTSPYKVLFLLQPKVASAIVIGNSKMISLSSRINKGCLSTITSI